MKLNKFLHTTSILGLLLGSFAPQLAVAMNDKEGEDTRNRQPAVSAAGTSKDASLVSGTSSAAASILTDEESARIKEWRAKLDPLIENYGIYTKALRLNSPKFKEAFESTLQDENQRASFINFLNGLSDIQLRVYSIVYSTSLVSSMTFNIPNAIEEAERFSQLGLHVSLTYHADVPSDEDFKKLENTSIWGITFHGSTLNNELLQTLRGTISTAKALHFIACTIDASCDMASTLTETPTLEELSFNSSIIQDQTLASLEPFIRTTSTLRRLDLSDTTYVSDDFPAIDRYARCKHPDQMIPLITAIGNNNTLQVLNLTFAGCMRYNVKHLVKGLTNNTSLRRLELGYFAEDHASAISEILPTNTTLQVLEIYGHRIVDYGTIRGYGISDEGAMALASALQKNTTLQKLCLIDTGITGKGAGVLATAVAKHPGLQNFSLILTNKIVRSDASAMREILKDSPVKFEIDDDFALRRTEKKIEEEEGYRASLARRKG